MIFKSHYWRAEVGRLAAVLRRHTRQRRWPEASDASVEKRVMLGFYAIRKMSYEAFEPVKAPAAVKVVAFPRNSHKRSPISYPEVIEAFDLTAPRPKSMLVKEVCNQIIHSHFFALWFGPDRMLHGVFFCSDWEKDKEVYRL